jgi:hypothetical protein
MDTAGFACLFGTTSEVGRQPIPRSDVESPPDFAAVRSLNVSAADATMCRKTSYKKIHAARWSPASSTARPNGKHRSINNLRTIPVKS